MNEEIEKLLNQEQLTLAPIAKRFIAFVIDNFLVSIIFVIIIWSHFVKAATTQEVIAVTDSFILEYIALKIIYQTLFVYMYGASIGKIIMKIRVIEVKTLQKPSFIVSFNRAVFRIVSEMIFYLGFLWGVLNPTRQAWHDATARTLVIDA